MKYTVCMGFPGGSDSKESACNVGDLGLISGSGRSTGEENWLPTPVFLGFPCGSAGKESACNVGDLGSIPGLGRSPGEGNGYPLQHSGLENSMDCIVHGVAESVTAELLSLTHSPTYCGQESHRRNGVALIINRRVQNAVVVCNIKSD